MGVSERTAAVFFRRVAGPRRGAIRAVALPAAGEVWTFLLGIFCYAGGICLFQGKRLLRHGVVSHLHCIWLGVSGRRVWYGMEKISAASFCSDTVVGFYPDVPLSISQ